jgi:hypothetical protein
VGIVYEGDSCIDLFPAVRPVHSEINHSKSLNVLRPINGGGGANLTLSVIGKQNSFGIAVASSFVNIPYIPPLDTESGIKYVREVD